MEVSFFASGLTAAGFGPTDVGTPPPGFGAAGEAGEFGAPGATGGLGAKPAGVGGTGAPGAVGGFGADGAPGAPGGLRPPGAFGKLMDGADGVAGVGGFKPEGGAGEGAGVTAGAVNPVADFGAGAAGTGFGGRLIIAPSRGVELVGGPSLRGGRTIRTVSFFGSLMLVQCAGGSYRFFGGHVAFQIPMGVSTISLD